jgi:hypothetical protein
MQVLLGLNILVNVQRLCVVHKHTIRYMKILLSETSVINTFEQTPNGFVRINLLNKEKIL